MKKLKLGVEVVSAQNLLPRDGHGSSSPLLELYFDGQRLCTSVKEKDLNPVWNERFFFCISDPAALFNLSLEASIYSIVKGTYSRTFLGKVLVPGTSFVPYSDAVVLNYSLEKNSLFCRARGEVGLKVFVTDDPNVELSKQKALPQGPPLHKEKTRHVFHHLPNPKLQQPVVQNAPDPVMNLHSARKYGLEEMQAPVEPPKVVHVHSSTPSSSKPEYAIKETSPFLGGGRVVQGRVIRGSKTEGTYDLVERMHFLYIRVVKARDLPHMDLTGSLDPFVEVRVGNYKGITKHLEKEQNPEWHAVFAFSKDQMQATVLEVRVKDKDFLKDDFVGLAMFDLNEIPMRVPPDSPLAPEWYRLIDKKGDRIKGELMLAIWIGTQADEAFADASHSDSATALVSSHADSVLLRSKVYHAPRLWYLRVNVIEVQDVVPWEKTRVPDVFVKGQLYHQILRTRGIQAGKMMNALWNEDLVFVAAEPFDDHIVLTLEDRVAAGKDEVLGHVVIPLRSVEKRADDRPVHTRWFNLEKPVYVDVDQLKKEKFSTRLCLRVCLDGGYHVLDESTHYSSDLRPTAKQLWKPAIGVLELGILNAVGLNPTKTRDGRGTSDTYCVAKYGRKWVRTRTVADNLSPKFNEQYTWEVFDTATVLTIGVFDNSQIGGAAGSKDLRVGKVRIRISTLETQRVYTHSYPLLVLTPAGVKKMGELHLAIRFSCTSFANMMYVYSKPLLPKMHYVRPFDVHQLDRLRHQAVHIVAARLGRTEPPLRKEVVEYMSDSDSHLWSLRRSKANFARIMSVFSGLFAVGAWLGEIRMWRNPITTVLVHILYLMLVCFPELILPTAFLYMFLIGLWNFRHRPRYPPHMNTRLSQAEQVHPDEMDEEFDTFPTTKNPDLVRMRYDRMRSIAGRLQTVIGDIATQGERLQSLLSWRDPRATIVAVTLCLLAAVVLYVMPVQVIAGLTGIYWMRHPRFRHYVPSAPVNFFRRLPAQTDCLL